MVIYIKILVCILICTVYFGGGFLLGFQNGTYEGALREAQKEIIDLRNRVYPGAIMPDSLVLQALPEDYTLGKYE